MNGFLKEQLERIEGQLAALMPETPGAGWVDRCAGEALEGVRDADLAAVIEPGRDLLARGGKRWRPLLAILFAELCGSSERALSLCPLVELAHNGSLIVDDIEDGALRRRGGPAAHVLFGTDTAINSGSFLYFLPAVVVEASGLTEREKLLAYRYYLEDMRRLHLGQGLDILWHRRHETVPGVQEYLQMCRLKTGSMARLAARLGVLAGGGGEELAGHCGSVAEQFGVGFQIIDDVRNLTAGVPGKSRGDDIVEGKKSLPVILYLAGHPEGAAELAGLFLGARASGGAGGEVERAIELLTGSGAVEDAAGRAVSILRAAGERLRSLFPPSKTLELTLTLIASLVEGWRIEG